MWNLDNKNKTAVFSGHRGYITGLAFSLDGTVAISGSLDKCVKIWNVATGKPQASFIMPAAVSSVCLSRDKQLLAAGTASGQVALWDLSTTKRRFLIDAHESDLYAVGALAISPDNLSFVSGGRGTQTGEIKIWDTATGRLKTALTLKK